MFDKYVRNWLPMLCQKKSTRWLSPPETLAENHVGRPGEDWLQQLGIFGGVVFQIGVLDDDDIARRHVETGPDGGAFSPVGFQLRNLDTGILATERLDLLERPVPGPVVNDNDLQVQPARIEIEHLAYQGLDGGFLVEARYDDHRGLNVIRLLPSRKWRSQGKHPAKTHS